MMGLRIEQEGAIARIVLARPEAANAIDLAMAESIAEAAIRCDEDDAIRCVVLEAEGRLFCAGGDVTRFAEAGDDAPTYLKRITGALHMGIARLARMEKPLVTLVQGPAAGAGMSVALLGDIVLASERAHFTPAYGAIGLSPDGGMTWLLPRLVGLRRAQELLITNRRIGAEEAVTLGLVTRVVADGTLADEGMALAKRLAAGPTVAIANVRTLLLSTYASGLESQMEAEARAIAGAVRSDHGREGLAAFLGKRAPRFG